MFLHGVQKILCSGRVKGCRRFRGADPYGTNDRIYALKPGFEGLSIKNIYSARGEVRVFTLKILRVSGKCNYLMATRKRLFHDQTAHVSGSTGY